MSRKKITILNHYLLISFVGISVFFGISACAETLNQKNFSKCRNKLEADRQRIREDGGYSYKAMSFEECRSPARYRIDAD